MATLQEIIDGLLGTSTTTRLPDDVSQALGSPPTSETPITDLVNSLKQKRQSPRTGTRAISPDSLGALRPTSEAPYGPALPPQPLNPFGGMELDPNEFTKARIALNRAQNPQVPDEFIDVNTPLPFGLNYNRPQVTDQDNVYGELGIGEQNVATRPPVVPLTPYSEPDMEEVNADNLILAQLASPTTPDGTPKDPGKFAGDMVTRSTLVALEAGRNNAEYNNQKSLLSDTADSISGLLGDFDFKGLLRVLARPEFVAPMGPGQSPITNFVNAAAADRRDRSASALENRKLAAKQAMDQFNRAMRQGELSVKERKLALDQLRLDRPQSIAMTEANVKNIGNLVYSLYTDDIENLTKNDKRVKRMLGLAGGDLKEGEVREAIQSAIATQAIVLMQQDRDLEPAQAIAKVLGKGAPVDEFAPNSK
jgi:hypothetical protein